MTTYTPSDEKILEKPSDEVAGTHEAREYLNPYLAGILLGVVLVSAFFQTGSVLAASGG